MEAFGKLAQQLIAEMPVAKLQEQLGGGKRFDGGLCGGNCGGPIDGMLCGLGCRPKSGAPDVIDPEGRSGLTAQDLAAIRNDMPQLRKAVLDQLRTHLHQISPGARPA